MRPIKKYKGIATIIIVLFFISFAVSCNDSNVVSEDPELSKLYMPQAINSSIDLKFTDEEATTDTVAFGGAIGGYSINNRDIPILFDVSEEQVNVYNDKYGTDYVLLPQQNYKILHSTLTIPKGSINSPLDSVVIFSDNLEEEIKYILPIMISSEIPEINYNEELRTLFILITISKPQVTYDLYDQTKWKIHTYSSHDPWEGGAEGNITSLIDGNRYTFWVTKWQGGEAPLPHFVSFDLQEITELHGVAYMNRDWWGPAGNGTPAAVSVYSSNNGESWDLIESFEELPLPADAPPGIWVQLTFTKTKKVSCRYFKFEVIGIYGSGQSTSIAEITAF